MGNGNNNVIHTWLPVHICMLLIVRTKTVRDKVGEVKEMMSRQISGPGRVVRTATRDWVPSGLATPVSLGYTLQSTALTRVPR